MTPLTWVVLYREEVEKKLYKLKMIFPLWLKEYYVNESP